MSNLWQEERDNESMRVEQQAWIQSSSSYDYDLEQKKWKQVKVEVRQMKIMAAEEIGGNKNGGRRGRSENLSGGAGAKTWRRTNGHY